MSSTGAFVPAAAGGAAGIDDTNRPNSITSGTPAQQQPSHHQSDRSAEIPNDEEIAAIGSSFATSLRIHSPPEIPALPEDLGRLVFLGDVGAVVVTSATSASTATANHLPLPPTGGGEQSGNFGATSATTTGTQPTPRSASLTSTTSTMTASPSPSLIPRRSPYVPPSLFLPAATGKSSSTSTATTAVSTPGTATPILLPSASSSVIHHQQPHDSSLAAPSILTTLSPFSTGTNSSTPPRTLTSASLPRVVYTTPKTNGTSSAALRVPGAPEKKRAGQNEIFYYERHSKAGPFTISPELLVVAEQKWMEIGGATEAGNVPTRGYKPLVHTHSLDALALAASTEEPNQATSTTSNTAAEAKNDQRPTTSNVMDRLTAALEAVPSTDAQRDIDMHKTPREATSPKAKTSKKKKKPSKMDHNVHRAAPDSTPVAVGSLSRRQILFAIPESVKSRFRELGFAQWGKNMFFPVIELSPYDIPLDDVREEWMTKFERSRKGSRKMHSLVYWYGSDGLDGAFSLIAPSKVVDYDTGVCNGYHLIPTDLQRKVDQGRILSQDEYILVQGLEVIEREQKLVSKDRVKWLLEESTSTKKTPASTSTASSNDIDESIPAAAKTAKQRPARKAANTRSEHGHFRVGQKILKNFPGYKEPFLGEITLLPTTDFAYYRVSYEDGDQEDVSIDDISKHVAMYYFSDASTPIKAAEFKIGQIIEKKFPGFGRFRGKIIKLPSLGKEFYRVKYQDNDIEDIASDEIGKYVIRDLASKKPLVAAKTSPKRKKKESNASHEMTRRVRPKISSPVERSTRVHD